MKKLLAVILACAMVIALAACGSSTPENTDNNDPEPAPAVTEAPAAPVESAAPETEATEPESVPEEGAGPQVIANQLFTCTVPEGLNYEIYNWYEGEGEYEGLVNYEIDLGSGSIMTNFRLTTTTQRYGISSLDTAAAECERMESFNGSKTVEYLDDTEINGTTYKVLRIYNDSSENIYYVSYRDFNGKTVYIQIKTTTKASVGAPMTMDDELVKAFVNSIEFN